MMNKCWEPVPESRPQFSEISEFLSMLLTGRTPPTAGSDEAAGYNYVRRATRHIPEDYADVNSVTENEDYVVPVPSGHSPVLPRKQPPIPAKRTKPQERATSYVVDAYEVKV